MWRTREFQEGGGRCRCKSRWVTSGRRCPGCRARGPSKIEQREVTKNSFKVLEVADEYEEVHVVSVRKGSEHAFEEGRLRSTLLHRQVPGVFGALERADCRSALASDIRVKNAEARMKERSAKTWCSPIEIPGSRIQRNDFLFC